MRLSGWRCSHRKRNGIGGYGKRIPTQADIPSAPNGTTPIQMTVYKVASRSWPRMPVNNAMTEQAGVMIVHRTMFLAYRSLRSRTGSSIAAMTRYRSGPSTLVAGTSEYVHAARTSANASEPCRVNTLSFRLLGRKDHAELMRAPLAATVMRVS